MTSVLQLTGFGFGDSLLPAGEPTAAFYLLLKGMFIIAGFLYVLFSLVAVRQTHVMRSTLITRFSTAIQLLAYIHMALAVGVFFYYLLFL